MAFVGYRRRRDNMAVLVGTAFFLIRAIPSTRYTFEYTVTAKHVLDAIRDQGADQVLLRVNMMDGTAQWIETDINSWSVHPDDDEVDVAVYRSVLPESIDNRYFPIDQCATSDVIKTRARIGLGDEVCIPGLFVHHYGQVRNIPIIRVGNIAAMPEEKIESTYGLMDGYLIEARSIGGLSGSPVFANIPKQEDMPGGYAFLISSTEFYLIGLMQGHWDSRMSNDDSAVLDAEGGAEKVNVGIGIVVPVDRILEVINQPKIRKHENEQVAELRKGNLPELE